MRLAMPIALLLVAAAAPRQGCGNGTPPAYDPCGGKACGERCTLCAPDDADCAETAVVKACDPLHRCVAEVDGLCAAVPNPCAGKVCGDRCTWDPPCRYASPPCMTPSVEGYCANDIECVAEPPPCPLPPSWGCVGKRCGDSCGVCPPGTDPASCPVPTFAATACDAALQCATVGTFTCPPDPCAGKVCGTACDPCGGLCMHPYASACDPSGACAPVPVTCAP